VSLAVNLFPVQIRDRTLPDVVKAELNESGVPPDLLELEISENFAFYDDAEIVAALSELRRHGVSLALDDLGIGQASLNCLIRLPVSEVKIDQSFVRKMTTDEKSAVMVQSLIAMAHGLGMGVVAEGVEDEEQAHILSASGCDRVQGYLFAKPLPAGEFEKLLAERVEFPLRAAVA
jgi:EAL domain-containing protein (putative c-di-GMP-specific phosphodiesterase class I)